MDEADSSYYLKMLSGNIERRKFKLTWSATATISVEFNANPSRSDEMRLHPKKHRLVLTFVHEFHHSEEISFVRKAIEDLQIDFKIIYNSANNLHSVFGVIEEFGNSCLPPGIS